MTAAASPLTGDVLSHTEADLAALAHRADAEVRDRAARLRTEFVAYGVWLRVMYDSALYAVLGYDTWESYLADPEVNAGISRRHIYRMVRIARAYVPSAAHAADGGAECAGPEPVSLAALAAMGVIKADLVAAVVADPAVSAEERDRWVAAAQTLSVSDLRAELREREHGPAVPPPPEAAYAAYLGRRLRALADRLELEPLGAVVAALGEVVTAARRQLEVWRG